MTNRLLKLPTLVYVPAVAPVIGRAAYCVTTRELRGYAAGPQQQAVQPVAPDMLWKWEQNGVPGGYGGINLGSGIGAYSPYVPVYVDVVTCYPAIAARPGSPARTEQKDNFAWNSGARSITPVPNDGYVSAAVGDNPVGVQVGFGPRNFAGLYSEASHSVVVRRDEATIVEFGYTAAGPFPAPSTIEVRRQRGQVSYLLDGVEVYSSAIGSAGEAYMVAGLYATGDFVDSPSIGALANMVAELRVPAVAVAIADDDNVSWVVTETAPVALAAQLDRIVGVDQFSCVLPAVIAIAADAPLSRVMAKLPGPTIAAELGLAEEVPTNMVAMLPPLTLSATLMTGQSLSFSHQVKLAFVAADVDDYAFVRAELPVHLKIAAVAPYLPEDVADGSDAVALYDFAGLDVGLLLIAMDGLEVSSSAELTLVLELTAMDGLSIAESASLGSVVEMLAMEQVAVFSDTSIARRQALQYAMNIATGAPTRYEGFDYLAFATVDQVTYALKADGLYRLGDATEPLERALVDFGATDLGSSNAKRMESAYLGLRTDGEVFLRVRADAGHEQVYRACGVTDTLRARLAKGVVGRTWNIKLELVDPSFAEVDSIELFVGVSQRRGFGQGLR